MQQDRKKKKLVEESVRRHARAGKSLALEIHEYAEPALEERKSADAVAKFLSERGFKVEFPYKSVPTAIRAVRGKGKPTVGLLGEYDALPDCGTQPGEWGHGCGHNLLGTAPAMGSVAVADALEAAGKPGRVVYYGCPAEETLGGKPFMARDGAFLDLDACLSWHPASAAPCVKREGGSAMDSLTYEFFGRTSHAAGSPQHGRSALDAAILLDIAINYLREHIPDNVRIHSVIRDGGGTPNVVPAYARAWYYVRGLNREQVDRIRKRMDACARGAAMATEVEAKISRLVGIYDRLRNDVMSDVMRANLDLFGGPRVTAEDRKRVKKQGLEDNFLNKPGPDLEKRTFASSDDSDISWIAPMAVLSMPCYSSGCPGHHRLLAEQSAWPFALRGMTQAAKVFAGSAWDLCNEPEHIKEARKEFNKRRNGMKYKSLAPKGKPRIASP